MANCFATSVGSKALTVKQAVVIASVCEFFGALLMGSNVAKTIRKGIADVNCYKDNPGLLIYGMTCVIIAVAIWLVLASYLELPVSTTHSCVGGIIGMTLMTRSTRCVIWNKDPDNMAFENFPWTGGVAQIVISWVLSPVASGVCAAALYAVVRYGIFAWENCYLRARVAFPLVVFFTVTVNVTYFIVKGAKGQAERFGTVGMVREAKEEGNLAPAIGMGSIFGAVAAAVAAGMLPMLSKKVEAEDFTDSVAGARADPADVEAKAVDAEAGAAADADAEATELDGAKAYIGGQLTRDTHKDLKTDKVVGAIHANVKEFDPRAEFFFRYVQVFTAMVDVDAKIQRERAINFDFHTGCLKAVRASMPGSLPSAASAGSSRSSSSARRPRSSSGPRPSRSRASTATTTARSTPASGCSERTFPRAPRSSRYRPDAPWSSRSTRGARARDCICT